MPDTDRAAFFDLDRTLLTCNSAVLWVRSQWRAGRIGPLDLLRATTWLVRYAHGRGTGLETAYAQAVARLSGEPEIAHVQMTRQWFERHVRHRLRRGALEALARHRAEGDRLVLATSSSLYAAQCAAEAFDLDDAIGTRFEVVDGHFTGQIASMAYGPQKAERVREWATAAALDLKRCVFYTDSITDLALLEQVGEPVAVNPDRRLRQLARQRGWLVQDWGSAAADR